MDEEAWIKVDCIVKEKGKLHFTTQNSKKDKLNKSASGGLGNKNIERKLELNYLGQYELNFKEEDEVYTVELIMQLENGN